MYQVWGDFVDYKDILDDSEKTIVMFKYVGWTRKVKILGATTKRSFLYKKSHNDYKIVTSHKAISQIEYGHYRIPIWLWLLELGFFSLSLFSVLTSPTGLDIILFIPACIALIITILYRKFDFINTAVGCEPFRVLSIRSSIIDKIEEFINILHSNPTDLRNTPEEFVQSNYYELLFNRLLSLISILYSPLPFYIDVFLFLI